MPGLVIVISRFSGVRLAGARPIRYEITAAATPLAGGKRGPADVTK